MPIDDRNDYDSDLPIQILQALDSAGSQGIEYIESQSFAKRPGFLRCMQYLKGQNYIEADIQMDRGRGPNYSIRSAFITQKGKKELEFLIDESPNQ
ncbi:MAG: hypothetical protein ABII68_08040 [Pseudomonadota bacterium]